MKKTHKILIGILALQIIIFAASFATRDNLGKFQSDQNLIPLATTSIDKIQIEDKAEKTTLVKKNGQWIIPDDNDFPANQTKIDDLLAELKDLKTSWPVGSTFVAAKQFKTSEDDFNKKVFIYEKDKVIAKLFVGSSPGFKKVHMRIDDEKNTYAVAFQQHKLQTKSQNWRNTDLLKVQKADISKITLNDFELQQKNEAWKLNTLADTEEMEPKEVDKLIDKITNLTFNDVLGTEDKKEYGLSKPVMAFKISSDKKDISYEVAGPYEENFFVLKTSTLPYYFKVNKAQIEDLQGFKRASIVQQKKVEPTEVPDQT